MNNKVEMYLKARDQMAPVLRRNSTRFKQWARKIKTGFLVVVAAATSAITAVSKLANSMAKMYDIKEAFGLTAQEVQELNYAFEQTGGSVSDLEMAQRTLQRFMVMAGEGTARYTDMLDQMGLRYEELARMGVSEQFNTVASALQTVDDEATRAQLALQLFSRSGQAVMTVMAENERGFEGFAEQFRELDAAWSEEQLAKAKGFSDALTDLKTRFQVLAFDAMEPMMPVIEDLLNTLMDMAQEILPALVPSLEAALSVVQSLLPAIEALTPAIELAGQAAKGLSMVLEAVVADMTNYPEQQQQVTDAMEQSTEMMQKAVSQGYLPMATALEQMEADVDAATDAFGPMSDAAEAARQRLEEFQGQVLNQTITSLRELAQELREDVRLGLITASDAEQQYQERVAQVLPLLEQYRDHLALVGIELDALAGRQVSLMDRATGAWSRMTRNGRNLWGELMGWVEETANETAEEVRAEVDTTAQEVEKIMERLQALGQIDLHALQQFPEAMAEIHAQVQEMDPERISEYLETLTQGQRKMYAEYLEWLEEARERELESEKARKDQRVALLEERMAAIEAEKQAAIAAAQAQQEQMEAAREKAVQAARQFGEGLIDAAMEGKDAVKQWGDAFYEEVKRLVTSALFKQLLSIFMPGGGALFGGGGGLLSGIFSFKEGGTPGAGAHMYRAAAGFTAPSHGQLGDRFLTLISRGEGVTKKADMDAATAENIRARLLSRAAGRGGTGNTFNVYARNPILTEGEMARVGTMIGRYG